MTTELWSYIYDGCRDNRLHKNAYRGNLDRVNKAIKNDTNIYTLTDLSQESALFLAITNRQLDVCNVLLDAYESDLKFIDDAYKCENFYRDKQIVVVFGEHQIETFYEHYDDYKMYEPSMEYNRDECVVILVKETNVVQRDVIFLSPTTQDGKIILVKILKDVLSNGCLDVNGKGRLGYSLCKVAAAKGLFSVVQRLIDLGAKENISDLAMIAAKFGEYECFKQITEHYIVDMNQVLHSAEFLNDIGCTNWNCVKLIVDTISSITKSPSENLIRHISNRRIPEWDCNVFHYAIVRKEVDLAEHLFKFTDNWKEQSLNGNIPLHNTFDDVIFKSLAVQMIQLDPNVLEIDDAHGRNSLHKMAAADWTDVLKYVYKTYPLCQNLYYLNLNIGLEEFNTLVKEKKYKAAEIILRNSHLNLDYKTMEYLLSVTASGQNMRLLKYTLSLRKFNLTTAIISALANYQLKNYKYLVPRYDGNLNDIRSEDGHNLLTYAIWAMTPSLEKHTEEEKELCEYDLIDSEDDQDDIKFLPEFDKYLGVRGEIKRNPFKLGHRDIQNIMSYHALFVDLIERGVDYNIVAASSGRNLLHYSILCNDVEATKKLIQLGVDLRAYDKFGNLPVHYILGDEILDTLNLNTELINTPNNLNGNTLLHYLMHDYGYNQADLKLVKLIVEKGADVNAVNINGETPLFYVTDVDVCNYLLENKANINATDLLGNTAISAAFRTSRTDIARHLLQEESVDYMIVNKNGESYLKAFIADQSNSCYDYENPKFVDLMQMHSKDCGRDGIPLIMEAVKINPYFADSMIRNVDVDLGVCDKHGNTLLHIAAMNATYSCNGILLEKGIPVDVRNRNGDTPLHLMSISSQTHGCIYELLDNHAEINVSNKRGWTPLMLVAKVDHKGDTVFNLLLKGADIKISNMDKLTAYDYLNDTLKQMLKSLIK